MIVKQTTVDTAHKDNFILEKCITEESRNMHMEKKFSLI